MADSAGTPILVTGGTGTLGQLVVARLRERGRAVRVLSRRLRPQVAGVEFLRGDLASGEGLPAALAEVGTVIHCASSRSGDEAATRNLVRAAQAAEVSHLVFISIVGVDLVSMGYFRSKLRAERAVTEAALPWTVLRATQFHDLILRGVSLVTRLPLTPVLAGFISQPVDAGEVADRLVELSLGEPAGRVPDMGGPQVLTFAELVRTYLRLSHRRRLLLPIWLPGTGRIRAGGLVLSGAAAAQPRGRRTWEEFLREHLG